MNQRQRVRKHCEEHRADGHATRHSEARAWRCAVRKAPTHGGGRGGGRLHLNHPPPPAESCESEFCSSSAYLNSLSDTISRGNPDDVFSGPSILLYDDSSDTGHEESVYTRNGRTILTGRRNAVIATVPEEEANETGDEASVSDEGHSNYILEGVNVPTAEQSLYSERRDLLQEARDLHCELRGLYASEQQIHERIMLSREKQAKLQARFFEITQHLARSGRMQRRENDGPAV